VSIMALEEGDPGINRGETVFCPSQKGTGGTSLKPPSKGSLYPDKKKPGGQQRLALEHGNC